MEPISLTISDLVALRNIIDLASSRGAFKAPELKDVGTAYERLSAFIEAAVEQSSAEQQATELPEN
jgi:hypothetical protein